MLRGGGTHSGVDTHRVKINERSILRMLRDFKDHGAQKQHATL